jgi:predicted adenylyl cyclase CyaB
MNLEIELKAHVHRPDEIRAALEGMAGFLRAYDKADSYYLLPGADAGQGRSFRIRTEDGLRTVTWKERSCQGHLEVNVEREFTISDEEAFIGLCLAMGARPYMRKRKIGRAFEYQGLNVELSEVPPLGHFIEIEKTIEIDGDGGNRPPEQSLIDAIHEAELALLALLDIPRDEIEEKPYSLLLREASPVQE